MVEDGQGPKVPKSMSPKGQGTQGPRYLKVTFEYELDSKEGPSWLHLFSCLVLFRSSFMIYNFMFMIIF